MFFDLKPGRMAWVVTDGAGAITASVPGSLELLAPYPGLQSFLGEWSQEWNHWAPEYTLLEREVPVSGERLPLLLEAVPIVPVGAMGLKPPSKPPYRVLICVSLPEERSAQFSLFQRRFDLTVAECRVAAEAAEGCTPSEIAVRLGLSVHTVRSHLKRMFPKAGVHSQAGLVRALLQGHKGGSRPRG
jgi:DNA-binding CsgD family transcriptional regulator